MAIERCPGSNPLSAVCNALSWNNRVSNASSKRSQLVVIGLREPAQDTDLPAPVHLSEYVLDAYLGAVIEKGFGQLQSQRQPAQPLYKLLRLLMLKLSCTRVQERIPSSTASGSSRT